MEKFINPAYLPDNAEKAETGFYLRDEMIDQQIEKIKEFAPLLVIIEQ